MKIKVFLTPAFLVSFLIFLAIESSHAQGLYYEGSTLWNGAYEIKLSETLAYTAFRNGLAIFDISNTTTPSPVSWTYCEGGGNAVFVAGNNAFLADGSGGLKVINIEEIQNPIIIGELAMPNAIDIWVEGSYAYIVDEILGLCVIDISDVSHPLQISHYFLPEAAKDIIVQDSVAYVATGWSGVFIFSVSDPSNPQLIGQYDTGYIAESICLSWPFLYIGDGWDEEYTFGYVLKVDISVPSNPSLAQSWTLWRTPYNLAVAHDIIYVAAGYDGLVIPGGGYYDTPGMALDIAIRDTFAFLADGSSSLQIFNVADTANPTFAGAYDVSHDVRDVALRENYAYVACGDKGLKIVDNSNPAYPVVIGSLDTPGYARDLFLQGDYAFVSDRYNLAHENGGLRVINISDPFNPFIGGSFVPESRHPTAFSVYAIGNYAFVGFLEEGIEPDININILNISSPYHPYRTARLNSGDYAVDLYATENLLFAACSSSGLRIFDVSNPLAPNQIGSLDSILAWGVDVAGNYAYIAGHRQGLLIIDISDPTTPFLAGTYDTHDIALGISIEWPYAYVADNNAGIIVIDVSNPSNPLSVASYETPGQARKAVSQGGLISIADFNSLINLSSTVNHVDNSAGPFEKYSLSSSYPNPFNATTTIEYSLSSATRVKMEIYDLLGNKIETLLDERQQAGPHRVIWDARDQSSGLYMYKIKVGDMTETKKTLFLK